MITADEYAALTGENAPEDFVACEALACEQIHGHTLYAYVGRDMTTLPVPIADKLKLAVALQTMTLSNAGGLAGAVEDREQSMSLGKYNYSGRTGGSAAPLSPAIQALMPMLVGYGRGLMA